MSATPFACSLHMRADRERELSVQVTGVRYAESSICSFCLVLRCH